jgi:hypothetical protein
MCAALAVRDHATYLIVISGNKKSVSLLNKQANKQTCLRVDKKGVT